MNDIENGYHVLGKVGINRVTIKTSSVANNIREELWTKVMNLEEQAVKDGLKRLGCILPEDRVAHDKKIRKKALEEAIAINQRSADIIRAEIIRMEEKGHKSIGKRGCLETVLLSIAALNALIDKP